MLSRHEVPLFDRSLDFCRQPEILPPLCLQIYVSGDIALFRSERTKMSPIQWKIAEIFLPRSPRKVMFALIYLCRFPNSRKESSDFIEESELTYIQIDNISLGSRSKPSERTAFQRPQKNAPAVIRLNCCAYRFWQKYYNPIFMLHR
jgi:hypothetical protein